MSNAQRPQLNFSGSARIIFMYDIVKNDFEAAMRDLDLVMITSIKSMKFVTTDAVVKFINDLDKGRQIVEAAIIQKRDVELFVDVRGSAPLAQWI